MNPLQPPTDVLQQLVAWVHCEGPPRGLNPMLTTIGRELAFVLTTKILGAIGWDELPITVDRSWTWCRELESVLPLLPDLDGILELTGNSLGFAPGLSREKRAQFQKYVKDRYKPRLLV